jgi:hypothetical protein
MWFAEAAGLPNMVDASLEDYGASIVTLVSVFSPEYLVVSDGAFLPGMSSKTSSNEGAL